MRVYARDSRSSRLLAVLPRCACTLAYRTVPLQMGSNFEREDYNVYFQLLSCLITFD